MQTCYCYMSLFLTADSYFVLLFLSSILRLMTPNMCESILESTPRTPTPLRSASTHQEIKYGPVKLMVRDFNVCIYPSVLNLTCKLLLCTLHCPRDSLGGLRCFQNTTLGQQMVGSIKQEPVEDAIKQPPFKKIKQEVLSTLHRHVHICKKKSMRI